MPDIDTRVVCLHLTIDPTMRPMSKKMRKVVEEKRDAIDEEVHKLASVNFITKLKYPTCFLSNVVLMKKTSNKWCIDVDFTDLNIACPKDTYPLPNIDRLIDRSLGYKTLSFMNAYSGYN